MKFKISCLGEMLQRTQNSLVPHFGSRPYFFRDCHTRKHLTESNTLYCVGGGWYRVASRKAFSLQDLCACKGIHYVQQEYLYCSFSLQTGLWTWEVLSHMKPGFEQQCNSDSCWIWLWKCVEGHIEVGTLV